MHISYFIKQKSYERIVFMLRRHPITFIPIAALFLVLMAVPFGVYFILNSLFPEIIHGPIIYPIAVLGASLYYLMVYLLLYMQFIGYYLDLSVVTNDRIIDIEQQGLFDRVITELDLYRIQDVTTDVRGVFATLFHYGDVIISTASSPTTVTFWQVPNPDFIREELIRLADEDRKFHVADTKMETA